MSDYVRNVVVRMPLPVKVLKEFDENFDESYESLREKLNNLLGYDVEYQDPNTIHLELCYNDEKRKTIPYLDYIIEHYYGVDSGDYGFVLVMNDAEKTLYSSIFSNLFEQLGWEFKPSKMVRLTFRYYNGVDLPDYYPDESENNKKRKAEFIRKLDDGPVVDTNIMVRKFKFVKRIVENKSTKDQPFALPKRSTAKSAGYDFINPETIEIPPYTLGSKPVLVPTGVKVKMPDDEFLMLVNRSSNPKKKNLVIPNSMGIIDADYYENPDNDGEMMFAFYNVGTEPVVIKAGEKLGQGIFVKYGITDDDDAKGERLGGFGSTGV